MLYRMKTQRSCRGVSLKSQILFLVVFCCRYLVSGDYDNDNLYSIHVLLCVHGSAKMCLSAPRLRVFALVCSIPCAVTFETSKFPVFVVLLVAANMHACTRATHTHTYAHVHTRTHTYTHNNTHTNTHTHTHTYTHAHTHTDTQRAHTHKHTQSRTHPHSHSHSISLKP